ncbi:MAG: alpha/beta fold hydrolase [Candidatus Dormibacteria bacterium]
MKKLALILGHGAGGTAASLGDHVAGLLQRGVDARAIDLPRSGRSVVKAKRAVPAFAAAVTEPSATVVGGHSYGGRVASMLAAELTVRGLVLLSYPLHRPGSTDWEIRAAHWPRVRCPVLMLSGESDPFARLDLLRLAVPLLGEVELVTYPDLGHGMAPVLDDALDRVAAFVRGLQPLV